MYWAVIIALVLLIPILAIVLDSSVGQALANRISLSQEKGATKEIGARVEEIEAEVKYLAASLESLREETEFVRRLVEGSDAGGPAARLEPGE